jgi:hypothetical protein
MLLVRLARRGHQDYIDTVNGRFPVGVRLHCDAGSAWSSHFVCSLSGPYCGAAWPDCVLSVVSSVLQVL